MINSKVTWSHVINSKVTWTSHDCWVVASIIYLGLICPVVMVEERAVLFFTILLQLKDRLASNTCTSTVTKWYRYKFLSNWRVWERRREKKEEGARQRRGGRTGGRGRGGWKEVGEKDPHLRVATSFSSRSISFSFSFNCRRETKLIFPHNIMYVHWTPFPPVLSFTL